MGRISSNSATYEEIKQAVFTSAAVAVAAGICGRMELGTALRPINGISHILWGPQAGNVKTLNAKYTLAGLALIPARAGSGLGSTEKVLIKSTHQLPGRRRAQSASPFWPTLPIIT